AGMMNLIFIGFMFAAMWFLIIAPQRKKQKQHAKMISELESGDEVLTAGGVYGEITSKKDDRFVVRISDGVKVEVAKSFITDVVKKKS
nr:preprotein translocase subunit YajC [Opitutaceae bacterium]